MKQREYLLYLSLTIYILESVSAHASIISIYISSPSCDIYYSLPTYLTLYIIITRYHNLAIYRVLVSSPNIFESLLTLSKGVVFGSDSNRVTVSVCVTVPRQPPRTPRPTDAKPPVSDAPKTRLSFFSQRRKERKKKTNKLATYVKLWAHICPCNYQWRKGVQVQRIRTATAAIIHIYPYRSRSISITAAYYTTDCTALRVRAEYVQETDACTYVRILGTSSHVHVPERTSSSV